MNSPYEMTLEQAKAVVERDRIQKERRQAYQRERYLKRKRQVEEARELITQAVRSNG